MSNNTQPIRNSAAEFLIVSGQSSEHPRHLRVREIFAMAAEYTPTPLEHVEACV